MSRRGRRNKPEQRQNYTDSYVSALLANATGEAQAAQTAAREVCAGLYERAFKSARIEPSTPETRAVSVECLGMIGRGFITRGESLFCIEADPVDGTVTLLPSSSWTVRGSLDPETWSYVANLTGPNTNVTRTVSEDSALHFKFATSPEAPWRGQSPLDIAGTTARIDEGITQQIANETGRSSGYVAAVPVGLSEGSFNALKRDIPAMHGKLALLEAGGSWDSTQQGGRPGLDVTRIGANPPPSVLQIWQYATSLTLAAAGVPIELLQLADGTGNRESWRRFIFSTIGPTAKSVEEELSNKFDMAVSLDFSQLQASDLSGRARAFQSMVGGGMAMERAASLSGLMVGEDD